MTPDPNTTSEPGGPGPQGGLLRLASESIEPVVKRRHIPLGVEAAFELFTDGMARWWPLATHSIAGTEACDVRVDGRIGGRITETATDGTTHDWAAVLAWDPPHRLVVAWHPQIDPVAASIVEVRFEPTDTGCRLHLEHRGWEEFGAEVGRAARDAYDPGWDLVLAPLLDAAAASAQAGRIR